MRLDILTLFPNMMSMFFEESILKRAQNKGIVDIHFHDLHDLNTTAGFLPQREQRVGCIDTSRGVRRYRTMRITTVLL